MFAFYHTRIGLQILNIPVTQFGKPVWKVSSTWSERVNGCVHLRIK